LPPRLSARRRGPQSLSLLLRTELQQLEEGSNRNAAAVAVVCVLENLEKTRKEMQCVDFSNKGTAARQKLARFPTIRLLPPHLELRWKRRQRNRNRQRAAEVVEVVAMPLEVAATGVAAPLAGATTEDADYQGRKGQLAATSSKKMVIASTVMNASTNTATAIREISPS
jgi:hypothetical protein